MNSKYSILELMFCNKWQWVRKRTKMFWVKDLRDGYSWVKFNQEEIDCIFKGNVQPFLNLLEFDVEDWRPVVN